jgi:excisionase family DNA binding protein
LPQDIWRSIGMTQPDFVSVETFARRTGLSVRTVWRLVHQGQVGTIRVGRRRLIPLRAALEAISRGKTDKLCGPPQDRLR